MQVLEKMNFGTKWVRWTKGILETSRISVLVIGTPTKEFFSARELRQGDPLSPLLFNLVGETLSQLLQTADVKKMFKRILLPNSSVELTHLQFADDVILFIQNDTESIKGVKRVLQCFEFLSGLHIDFEKSSLYTFHENQENLLQWAEILGYLVIQGPILYLGAIIRAPHTSTRFWDPLLDKIKGRLLNR